MGGGDSRNTESGVIAHGTRAELMTHADRQTSRSPGFDDTLDVPPAPVAPRRSVKCPNVEVVQGSESGLSGQTHSLLRARLRSASLVLLCGSLAFLIKSFLKGSGATDPALAEREQWLTGFHIVHLATLVAMSGMLCRRCEICITRLRLAEAVIFGVTAAYLVCVQHYVTVLEARVFRAPFNPVGMWYLLLFTYGMFIPNGWKHTALVVGGIAALPVAVLFADRLRFVEVARVMRPEFVGVVILMLALGAGVSIYGNHMVGALRREAYEARQLGQYRLRSVLGSGGMGEVYLAEHQLLKRPCAIKLIRPSKAGDPLALARFEREVRATAALSHWNTVEIFDYGSTNDGTFYYVMEYLPGLSLADLVDRHGPLPAERVIHLLGQTCDALGEAHQVGLIHRDLKPGNIFAAQRGGVYDVAKLLDFGLAKPIAAVDEVGLTQDGAITGSPLYMSPEQVVGDREPDARTDIYALGAVAYFVLTGRPPFTSDKPVAVLLAHARDEVLPPSKVQPGIPADIEAVILKALAKRPEDRFQTVEEFRDALSGCADAGRWTRQRARQWWQSVDEGQATEPPSWDPVADWTGGGSRLVADAAR